MVVALTALVVAAAIAVGVVAARAVDDADTLDVAATEEAVANEVSARIAPGVDEVRCPEEIGRAEGTTVECLAMLAGDLGEVRLEVRQADDAGTLDVGVLDAVIVRSEVSVDLEGRLTNTFDRDFTIDCGAGIEVVAPGDTLTCDAADAFDRRTVTVIVTDAAGTLRYQLQEVDEGDGEDGDEGDNDDEGDEGDEDLSG